MTGEAYPAPGSFSFPNWNVCATNGRVIAGPFFDEKSARRFVQKGFEGVWIPTQNAAAFPLRDFVYRDPFVVSDTDAGGYVGRIYAARAGGVEKPQITELVAQANFAREFAAILAAAIAAGNNDGDAAAVDVLITRGIPALMKVKP